MGEERLIGGHHGFAGRERRRNRGLGRIPCPTDELDEDIDFRVSCKREGIRRPSECTGVDAAIFAFGACRYCDDLDRSPTAKAKSVALAIEQLHDRRAYRAESGKSHFERGNHGASQPA